jgi:dGTPase
MSQMNWPQLLSNKRPCSSASTSRNAFEQDYDRIIFSHAFRSLQDKTQVFPLATPSFVHTRLTHSLEVSSVARSLGQLVGEQLLTRYPDLRERNITSHDIGLIASSAALAHDIGNPPFGHSGEAAISEYFSACKKDGQLKGLTEEQWADLTHFEGNAQGFRLLTEGRRQGLQVTYATLGAFTKYPCASSIDRSENKRKSQKKHGFYFSGIGRFVDASDELGLKWLKKHTWCRHPLAFLVEAADDICYAVIDLEDATNLGLVDFETTKRLLSEILGDRYDEGKLKEKIILREKTGILRALAINQLIAETVEVFMQKEEEVRAGSFDEALTEHIPSARALKKIIELSIDKIYRSKIVVEKEVAGFEILQGLLQTFIPAMEYKLQEPKKRNWKYDSVLGLLPEETHYLLQETSNMYDGILLMLDFISGLTDSRALQLFQNIKGSRVSGYSM